MMCEYGTIQPLERVSCSLGVFGSECSLTACEACQRHNLHLRHLRKTEVSKAQSGPGTELKKILAKFGIKAGPNCACNSRARIMDQNGADWCEANRKEIIGWLRKEAKKLHIPCPNWAAALLLRVAIDKSNETLFGQFGVFIIQTSARLRLHHVFFRLASVFR